MGRGRLTMKKRFTLAMCAVLTVGAFLGMSVQAQPGHDPFTGILAKLDELLAVINSSAVDLRGVIQNWDKALPANDPGGSCPNNSSRFTCVFGGAAVGDNHTVSCGSRRPARRRAPGELAWAAT